MENIPKYKPFNQVYYDKRFAFIHSKNQISGGYDIFVFNNDGSGERLDNIAESDLIPIPLNEEILSNCNLEKCCYGYCIMFENKTKKVFISNHLYCEIRIGEEKYESVVNSVHELQIFVNEHTKHFITYIPKAKLTNY